MAHGSLADCLRPGGSAVGLGPAQRVRLLAGVAGGLIAMHGNRPPLFHRDVKAANVGVTHGCVAKVCFMYVYFIYIYIICFSHPRRLRRQ